MFLLACFVLKSKHYCFHGQISRISGSEHFSVFLSSWPNCSCGNSVLWQDVTPLHLKPKVRLSLLVMLITQCMPCKEFFLWCFGILLEIQQNTGLKWCIAVSIFIQVSSLLFKFQQFFTWVRFCSQLRVKKGLTLSELFFSSPTPCSHCMKFCLCLHALVWGQIAIAGLPRQTVTGGKWEITWLRCWTPPAVDGSYTCLSRTVTGIVI